MTVDGWLRAAMADIEARGLPEVGPLLESLASALRRVREAPWNLAADGPPPEAEGPGASAEQPGGGKEPEATPATPAGVSASWPERPDIAGIRALAARLRRREVSAVELTQAALEAIDRGNPSINAFITVTRPLALEQARAADARLKAGEGASLLCGIPVSLKDLIDLEATPTTAASRVRAGTVAARSATVTARLEAAGAVLVGKCNLHEFAFGTTNEDSAFGPARHPLDLERSPGGSSGGSAAAVLAGMCAASVGTDTGGSIRIPAAACGLVGLKPTAGAVPLDGVVPLAPTLDHVGPLARTVDDVSIMFDGLRGYAHETDRPIGVDTDPRRLRLGVPRPYFLDLLEDGVRDCFERAVDALRTAGATVDDVAVPATELIMPVYLATVLAEAAAYHARTLEARPGDYTRPVRIRLEMSRYVPAEDYVRAQQGRRVLRAGVDLALAGRDALLLPTLPIVAPRLGQSSVSLGGVTESVRTLTLRLTQLFNLTGHPAISLPCGLAAGLPVGLQLVGHLHRTRDVLRAAACCERLTG